MELRNIVTTVGAALEAKVWDLQKIEPRVSGRRSLLVWDGTHRCATQEPHNIGRGRLPALRERYAALMMLKQKQLQARFARAFAPS